MSLAPEFSEQEFGKWEFRKQEISGTIKTGSTYLIYLQSKPYPDTAKIPEGRAK